MTAIVTPAVRQRSVAADRGYPLHHVVWELDRCPGCWVNVGVASETKRAYPLGTLHER